MKNGLFIPDTLTERKKFLNSYLSQFVGKKFFCKAIGVEVLFNSNSKQETIYKAAISKKSTELAYYMPYIIEN
ncbi:MAG: hypothetical protein J5606_09485 [Bacteroidales bacterium]|nr:hypothetical protein [Bacteroidales bacterium]